MRLNLYDAKGRESMLRFVEALGEISVVICEAGYGLIHT